MTSRPRPQRALVLVLGAATLTYWLWLVWLDRPLRSDAAPSGIVCLELGFTDPRAANILADWHARGVTDSATRGLRWDYGFIPLYVAFLALATRWAAPRWRSAQWRRRVQWLGLAVLPCAPLDIAENLLLRRMLARGEPLGLALPTSVLASVKFLLVLLALGAILGSLVYRGRGGPPDLTDPRASRGD